jgi:hypothetical protein
LFPCDAKSFLVISYAEGIWSETAKRTTSKTVEVTSRANVAAHSSKINRDKDDAIIPKGIPKADVSIYDIGKLPTTTPTSALEKKETILVIVSADVLFWYCFLCF